MCSKLHTSQRCKEILSQKKITQTKNLLSHSADSSAAGSRAKEEGKIQDCELLSVDSWSILELESTVSLPL